MAPHNWTDDRLSERFDRIDERFDQVGHESALLRQEMRDGFARVDARFESMDRRFDGLEGRMAAGFANLHRDMVYGFIAMSGLMITALTTVIATKL